MGNIITAGFVAFELILIISMLCVNLKILYQATLQHEHILMRKWMYYLASSVVNWPAGNKKFKISSSISEIPLVWLRGPTFVVFTFRLLFFTLGLLIWFTSILLNWGNNTRTWDPLFVSVWLCFSVVPQGPTGLREQSERWLPFPTSWQFSLFSYFKRHKWNLIVKNY